MWKALELILDHLEVTTEPNFNKKPIFLMKIFNKITKKQNNFLTFRFCVRVTRACVRACTMRLRLQIEWINFLFRPNSAAKLFFSTPFFQTFPKTISFFPIQNYIYFNLIISIGLGARVIVCVSIHKVWISTIWHLAQTHAHLALCWFVVSFYRTVYGDRVVFATSLHCSKFTAWQI